MGFGLAKSPRQVDHPAPDRNVDQVERSSPETTRGPPRRLDRQHQARRRDGGAGGQRRPDQQLCDDQAAKRQDEDRPPVATREVADGGDAEEEQQRMLIPMPGERMLQAAIPPARPRVNAMWRGQSAE